MMEEKIIGGIKRECYPLSAAEMLHIFTLTYSPTQEIVNIGVGCYLQTELNQAALREALNRAIERCESMRLRFWKEPETGKIWQYVMPYENQYFEYYDFSQWSEEKANEVLNRWTSQPFDTYGGALSRVVLVSMPDGYNGYYINVHHSTMDSASVIAFNRDVMSIYCYLMYNMPYPKPTTSYIEALKEELKYEADSKKRKRDEAYWLEQFKKPEPIYADFTGPSRLEAQRRENKNPNQRYAFIQSSDAAGGTVTYSLDTYSTKKIIDFCEEMGIPVSTVLLHAIRTVISKFNNNEPDISIKDFVSRRSTVLAKKCGGVRMHCMNLRTYIEVGETVREALQKINKAQRDLFMHADVPPLWFYRNIREKYNMLPGAVYESVGFTYQPATIKSIVPYLKGIKSKSKWYSSGRQAQPLYITAMHRPNDGGLNFHFGYQKEFATEKEIEFLYYYIGRVLFRSIENPDKTIQEIMDMV